MVSPDALPAGHLLKGGLFRINAAIASGGFGVTYRATRISDGAPVVIKELLPSDLVYRVPGGLAVAENDPNGEFGECVRRFVREAEFLKGFDHPNIVPIAECFTDNGTAYFAMPDLGGRDLTHLIAPPGAPATAPVLSDAEILDIMSPLVDALRYIHRRNLFHFDIKPANILIRPDGQVTLIDFGAAKRLRSGLVAMNTQVQFTPGFAAPELSDPEQYGTPDGRADIYGLAATLLALATGKAPVRLHPTSAELNALNEPWRTLATAGMEMIPENRPRTIDDWWRLRFTGAGTDVSARDIFDLREDIVGTYQRYVRGFSYIKDTQIALEVEKHLDGDGIWPAPLVQLNPSFEPGESVEELASRGVLDPACASIFRRPVPGGTSRTSLRLHRHQQEAIEVARGGHSYVISTGTGSGKSLGYFIPIIDRVLREGPGKGIRAVVVYPMNALANSQEQELAKFLGATPAVTFKRYTGQESDAEKRAIRANPPDVLLTNFMMLELILTRSAESDLVRAMSSLKFLVLDELHTYRGRQGADVALLVRRLRQRTGVTSLQCAGTSATIASEGTRADRQAEVARVASLLFGGDVPVDPAHVIFETVQPACGGVDPSPDALSLALADRSPLPTAFDAFASHPLAQWLEANLGFRRDAPDGPYERRGARKLADLATDLAELTDTLPYIAVRRLRECLVAGNRVKHPTTGFPVFAYRLHQWIGRGMTVFATLEAPPHREITLETIDALPGRDGGPPRTLFPLAFCRECGAAYASVFHDTRHGRYLPRMVSDRTLPDGVGKDDGVVPGFLFVDDEAGSAVDLEYLPDDWIESDRSGNPRVKPSYRNRVPVATGVMPDGSITDANREGALTADYFPAPFALCLNPSCRVTHIDTASDDQSRVAQIATEGRSTATTILSLATVQALRGEPSMPAEARKLLSFSDNRQDASLQAGHFNDFIQVSLIRAAILEAVRTAGAAGLRHDALPEALTVAFTSLVTREEYDRTPDSIYEDDSRAALRDLLTHRAWHDLRRGWRLSFPNLEQVGLLHLGHHRLNEIAGDASRWASAPEPLRSATPEVRARVLGIALDTMRRSLAIATPALEDAFLNQLRNRSGQSLRDPWAVSPDEDLPRAAIFLVSSGPRPAQRSRASSVVSGGPRSLFGRYLRRARTWDDPGGSIDTIRTADYEPLARALFDGMVSAGLVRGTWEAGYQVDPRAIVWTMGNGTVPRDPVRRAVARVMGTDRNDDQQAVNDFFRDFYVRTAVNLGHLEAREHTAQVTNEDREDREKRFTTAQLPVLYCSPTMELGVDIAQLNAVHLRNVPPSPANYAQRSGRAGRSGQPALVLTYATDRAPHDAYYFRHPERMVSGQVATPRLDLLNEDLVRAHLHAVWLATTGADLPHSIVELLDLSGAGAGAEATAFPLQERFTDTFHAPGLVERATAAAHAVMDTIPDVRKTAWYRDTWVADTIKHAPAQFNAACDRWRSLYRSANDEVARQSERLRDASLPDHDHKNATQLLNDASMQLRILRRTDPGDFNDFYTYRYLASEGFLPGYNFPRLPLRAFLPGRHQASGNPVFLSRARFIALAEYGPRSVIYHEGAQYRVLYAMREGTDTEATLVGAKVCRQCGYGHIGTQATADVCDNCGTVLHGPDSVLELSNLYRLSSVRTQRIQRITCDEEERLRRGYDLRTTYRFEGDAGRTRTTTYADPSGQTTLASAIYGPATTLWRINLKWVQSKDELGFALDLTSGKWLPGMGAGGESDADPGEDSLRLPARAQVRRVVPYVEDRRNALVLTLDDVLERLDLHGHDRESAMASVQSALERAIETVYQLEDSDLAAEPVPDRDDRRKILLYEAAEGGAGVLSRLVDDRKALAAVSRKALELLHFDPDTGLEPEDRPAPCVQSCYDCLRSYYNQRDHAILDRHAARPVLLALAGARGEPVPVMPLDDLTAQCETDAERAFLSYLHQHRHRLPDKAQGHVSIARPDFYYQNALACIFIDGSIHQYADVAARDDRVRRHLETEGYTVIAIPNHPATWATIIAQYPKVFGSSGTQR